MNTPWRARYFTIWSGQQISMVGTRAGQFALVWWLTLETGSATVLAIEVSHDQDLRRERRTPRQTSRVTRFSGGTKGRLPAGDQVIDNGRIGQRARITNTACIVLGNLAQNAPHDLARTCLR